MAGQGRKPKAGLAPASKEEIFSDLDEQPIHPLIIQANRRGYLTINGSRIMYRCRRVREYNFDDPEERVRAYTYSWLIIERGYSPKRIDLEVQVPRREPSDFADIVVYEDDRCRVPYLVVENKAQGMSQTAIDRFIEQGYGNANSLRSKYMLFDCFDVSILFDVARFPPSERQCNRLGTREAIPENYGIPSQFTVVAGSPADIHAVSAQELERAVRRAHGTIWAGGKRDPLKSFDEWSKLLFAKVYDERHTPNGSPREFQWGVGETATQVARRIQRLYRQAREEDPTIFSAPEISLPDEKIAEVVKEIQHIGISHMTIDALGQAFEQFFGSIFRGDLGQYFTRRELVRFMVAMIQPRESDFVLDPTCGSGGFLVETLLQVWRHINAIYAGQPDLERRKYDFAQQHLFGIEIHEILGRVCQTNLLLHRDGHTNVEADRSCLDAEFNNPRLRLDGSLFTIVLGNPPFGDRIKADDRDSLGHGSLDGFELGRGRRQVKSEIVILERAFQFLKPGGRLAMVVPDGLLNNPGEQSQCPAFRRFLFRTARLDAIISLPDHAFRKSGAQNKTSILFATKYTTEEKSRFDRLYAEVLAELRKLIRTSEGIGEVADKHGLSVSVNGDLGFTGDSESEVSEARDTEDEAPEVIEQNSEEDDNGTPLSKEELAEAELETRALKQALVQLDYPVFLAEAEAIGYSPAGYTVEENDLYALKDGFPDPSDITTILGQYFLFKAAPDQYKGSAKPQCMALKVSQIFRNHPSYRVDPKFHLFERERLADPPCGMKLIRLGDVLKRRLEPVDPQEDPDTEFKVPTLTQEGKLIPREPGQGKNPPAWYGQYFTKGSRWYRVRAGDLLYSQIDLWKGCVTIVPDEWDMAIVTQEFPVYEIVTEEIDPHFLKLVLRSSYFRRAIRAITTGHSNRRRTQSDDFEKLTIFVPADKSVQRRISDLVRDVEAAVGSHENAYLQLLERFDKLIVGELEAEDFVSTRLLHS